MARGDLLVSLVRASMSGDKGAVQSTVQTIIAEERQKQHGVLADRLSRALHTNGNGGKSAVVSAGDRSNRGRDFVAETAPRHRLDDLILSEDARAVVDQLIEEQQRGSLLRAHGLDPRHRILLIGPPGNGKTSLAEAIAEALAVPFFIVRYDAMIGSFLGETASRLSRVFEYVASTPCVLFFDEFDAIGKERGDIHETGEIKRVVTSLLMNVDDLPSYSVVVAATNHWELLDRAVWRRFQLRIALPSPTLQELAAYFTRSLGVGDREAKEVAQRVGSISYAEAEEFTLDVRRRDVLSMRERSLLNVVLEQLDFWEKRAQSNTQSGC